MALGVTLSADELTVRAFVRARTQEALLTAVFSLPIATAIIVYDYRLVLLAIIALVPALRVSVEAMRVRVALRGRGIGLSLSEQLSISTPDETVALAPAQILLARVTPHALVVVQTLGGGRARLWTIPGDSSAIGAVTRELAQRGVQIVHERGMLVALMGILVGALAYRLLLVLSAALVVGALAQIGLAWLDHSGSIKLGLALLAGAFTSSAAAAIILQMIGRTEK